jgi:hypothetical protein
MDASYYRTSVMACTIFGLVLDLLHLVGLSLQSHAQLAAENLFLRKQLALYLERQVKPRRASNGTRLTLVVRARFIDWRAVLTMVQPETLVRVAPPRLWTVLTLEVSTSRPTADSAGASAADRRHGFDIASSGVWDLTRSSSAASRMTFAPVLDWYPVWTPDSRRIVFGSWRGGTFSISTFMIPIRVPPSV